jgi:deferrochelatase/peroxidase EfeB
VTVALQFDSEVLNRPDIQGLLLRAYQELPVARYTLLQIDDVATFRRWLACRMAAGDITTGADRPARFQDGALNIAFTASGLAKLGVAPTDDYDGFGLEFREGMTEPVRSRFLGDVGDNDPDDWTWGGRRPGRASGDRIDCLCLSFAASDAVPFAPIDEHWARVAQDTGATIVHCLYAILPKDEKEHFGFRDGISQPVIRFTKRDYELPVSERGLHVVEPGEFILGYENENKRMPVSPAVTRASDTQNRLGPLVRQSWWRRPGPLDDLRDFGRNGTYLVLRQIYQDVGEFRRSLRRAAGADPDRQNRLAARIVGRWPNGTPLALSPENDHGVPPEDVNNFSYHTSDPFGFRCPVGAHVRRGNPRDSTAGIDGKAHALQRSNFHRLLRRGRLYGPSFSGEGSPDAGADRGLIFICLNTDLRRQFEFVQQNWLHNRKFGGLLDEPDPLVGSGGDFTVQRPEGHERTCGLAPFVKVRGGCYFFMPGIAALQYLAD